MESVTFNLANNRYRRGGDNMQCNINGKEYIYTDKVRDNDYLRNSFNKLAIKIFGLDFEPWYQNGYWGDSYIPHVLIDNQCVVANVSVNIINTVWQNHKKCYIQLGTIMTDNEYRNKGLARWLINKVIDEWKDRCDSIYLFANNSVLDFYPKFGFMKATEYQYQMPISKKNGLVRKLDLISQQDKELLLRKYSQSNPFSALPMEQNFGLLMFYCSQFMKNNVYYVKQYDAIVIAEYDSDTLICYDIFCNGESCLQDILSVMVAANTKTVVLGFTPKQREKYKVSGLHEEDTTLFVLKDKENIFSDNQIMFPLLSHA